MNESGGGFMVMAGLYSGLGLRAVRALGSGRRALRALGAGGGCAVLLLAGLLVWPLRAGADAATDVYSGTSPSQPLLWLDGFDVNGTAAAPNAAPSNPGNGGAVSTWKDKSPYARSAVTATTLGSGYSAPTYATNQGVQFNTNNQLSALQVTNGLFSPGTVVNEADVFVVSTTSKLKYNYLFINGQPSASNQRISVSLGNAVGSKTDNFNNNVDATSAITSATTALWTITANSGFYWLSDNQTGGGNWVLNGGSLELNSNGSNSFFIKFKLNSAATFTGISFLGGFGAAYKGSPITIRAYDVNDTLLGTSSFSGISQGTSTTISANWAGNASYFTMTTSDASGWAMDNLAFVNNDNSVITYFDVMGSAAGRPNYRLAQNPWGGILGTGYIWEFNIKPSYAQYILRNAATQVTQITDASDTYIASSGDHFYLGNGQAGYDNTYSGVISEVLFYSKILTAVQRRLLINYLDAKHYATSQIGAESVYDGATTAKGSFKYYVGGIGSENDGSTATVGTSRGLTMTNVSFLTAPGRYLVAGLPSLTPASTTTTADVTGIAAVTSRAQRVWYLKTTTTDSVGDVRLSFNLATLGVPVTAGGYYSLLYRSGTSGNFVSKQITTESGGSVAFTVTAPASGQYTIAPGGVNPPQSLRIEHDGSGLTCQSESVVIKACANAACTTLQTQGTITGNLVWAGSPGATLPFTINSGGTGTGQTTVSVPVATAQTVTYSITSPSPAPTNGSACFNTSTSAASCSMVFSSSGFLVTTTNHVACNNSTVTLEAVQTNASTNRCVPAYASTTRTIRLATNYVNPSSGTKVATANAASISTNAASPSSHSLTFDATGKASFTLQYPDAGQISITATDTAASGAAMTGSANVVVAPATFAWSALPTAPIKAGVGFTATLTAQNACSPAATTANFTGQTVSISSSNPQPAPGSATAISSTATLTNGTGSTPSLVWNEVGTVDLTASLTNYLSSGLNVSGTRTAVGRFQPDHFDTSVSAACSVNTAFTYAGSSASPAYAGQPFGVTVTAKNLSGGTTQNYQGSYAYAVTLSNAGSATGLSGNTVAASAFASGVGTASAVRYSLATPTTAPATITLRALDADTSPVSSLRTTGTQEGTALLRAGRLVLRNAYGSERLALPLNLQAQFWTGTAYARNTDDSCTTVPASTIAMGSYQVNLAACETALQYTAGIGTLASGASNGLQLTAPGTGNNGSVALSLNLSAAAGNTCTPAAATATNLGATWFGNTNPSARAVFGGYRSPLIYRRENQ